jgi:hypothetical protein
MDERQSFIAKTRKTIGGAFLSLLLGVVGGGICGATILVFGAFIGRSGTTGTEHFGYWDAAIVPIGLFYGGLFGALMGPLAYALVVRTIGFQKAIVPAFLGTIMGGFLGAVAGPPFAIVTGICGFFIALLWAKVKFSSARILGNQ